MEASCCKHQYRLSHPYLFITQSAPSQQVRNWKIHECGPSNLSSLPSIMFSRFCAISENIFLFPFQNMKYEKSSKIGLCKRVLYNYRICFAKFKLKSELSQSSSYLFVVFIPFFRGVMYQRESWERRHVRGRVRKYVLYEWYFLHLVLKILEFKVKNSEQNKNIISNSVLLSHWPACFDRHDCVFTYISWTHSQRHKLRYKDIFCSVSTA